MLLQRHAPGLYGHVAPATQPAYQRLLRSLSPLQQPPMAARLTNLPLTQWGKEWRFQQIQRGSRAMHIVQSELLIRWWFGCNGPVRQLILKILQLRHHRIN